MTAATKNNVTADKMPSFEQVYDFVKAHYKPSRFEERNNATWGAGYTRNVVEGYMEQLSACRRCYIGQYESRTGESVAFDYRLKAMQ
jgi:hypothetical protein